jgi:hypothetical protein
MSDRPSPDSESKLDGALEDSFPGSDPVSISQPKPDRQKSGMSCSRAALSVL